MKAKVNTLVLKIASRCNIDCSYCYEYHGEDASWKSKPKRFSPSNALVLASRITEHCTSHGLTHFGINLHGGEPALAGAKYIDTLLSMLSEHVSVPLRFGMQTNGTLVDPELISVLKKHDVRAAVSVDGTEFANRRRVDHKGLPTWDRAVSGITQLKDAGLLSGIQTVVDLFEEPSHILNTLARYAPPEIELGQPFANHNSVPERRPPGVTLGDWLLKAFQVWVTTPALASVKVTILHDALAAVLSNTTTTDWFPTRPPGYLVVATDGALEGLDTLKISGTQGRVLNMNIQTHSFDDALGHEQVALRATQTLKRPTPCQGCAILEWCNGGYYPTRYSRENGFDNRSIYCKDWKILFSGIALWVLEQHSISEPIKTGIRDKLERLSEDM